MKKKNNKKLVKTLWIVLILSFLAYLFLYDKLSFMRNIIPEFIGVSLFSLVVYTGISKQTRMVTFYSLFGILFIISVLIYIYGIVENITFIIDIVPELIGATSLALILSIFFHKKMII